MYTGVLYWKIEQLSTEKGKMLEILSEKSGFPLYIP